MTPDDQADAHAANYAWLYAELKRLQQVELAYLELCWAWDAAVPVLNGHMNELREALGQPKAAS